MARVFVTGANGFIGRHLLEFLLARGDSVVGLVRRTSDVGPLAGAFERHGERLRLVVGDLREPASLRAGLEDDVEYVFHLGAVLLGTDEEAFRDSIVSGTANLLEAVQDRQLGRLRRFVLASSLAAAGPSGDGTPLTEQDTPHPVSWYGTAKRDAEALVRERAGGVPFTIVRPVAVYGEGELELARGTFPIVRAGFQPRIGLGQSRASWVYVGDVVRGMVAAAESETAQGRTYFLADPQPYGTGELGTAIADAMGKRMRLPLITPLLALRAGAVVSEWTHKFTRSRPSVTRDKVRELGQKGWIGSPAAAKQDFGWEAEVPLGEGIARQVRDWEAKRQAVRELRGLPRRDRAVMTYTLAVIVGIVLESLAWLGRWYQFTPPWLIFVVIFVVIGGLMGTVAYTTYRWPVWGQFLAGAAVGVGAELLNVWLLHAWTFNPDSFGLIPGDVLRAIVFGLPAGLMPVGVSAIMRSLYRRRLRLG